MLSRKPREEKHSRDHSYQDNRKHLAKQHPRNRTIVSTDNKDARKNWNVKAEIYKALDIQKKSQNGESQNESAKSKHTFYEIGAEKDDSNENGSFGHNKSP